MTEPGQRKPRISHSTNSPKSLRFAIAMMMTGGFLMTGCPEHPNDLYVQNASSKPISVKITGIDKPWDSKPIPPGGRQLVDRYSGFTVDRVRVKVFDAASGHQLLTESLDGEITRERMNSNDRAITYPTGAKDKAADAGDIQSFGVSGGYLAVLEWLFDVLKYLAEVGVLNTPPSPITPERS